MSTLSWIINDLRSLTPFSGSSAAVAPTPKVGDPAPQSGDGDLVKLEPGKKAVVAFQRHTGCPFAEKTIRDLIKLASANPSLQIHVILHSPSSHTSTYISSLLSSLSPPLPSLPTNVSVHSDPARTEYARWGVGVLGWGELFTRQTLSKVVQLGKDEGIKNRFTVGSRWQNHGTFAVDEKGTIVFVHIGSNAGDITDIDQVKSSLGL